MMAGGLFVDCKVLPCLLIPYILSSEDERMVDFVLTIPPVCMHQTVAKEIEILSHNEYGA
jgi:hypothetical protein